MRVPARPWWSGGCPEQTLPTCLKENVMKNVMKIENNTSIGDAITLGRLRAALAWVADLPDDTPVLRCEDDGNEPDSYAQIKDLEITFWDGEVQCDEGDEDAEPALFVW